MKKIIALFLVTALCLSLAACGSADAKGPSEKSGILSGKYVNSEDGVDVMWFEFNSDGTCTYQIGQRAENGESPFEGTYEKTDDGWTASIPFNTDTICQYNIREDKDGVLHCSSPMNESGDVFLFYKK